MTETLQIPAEGETWQKLHNIVPVPNETIRRDVLHYAALCLPDRVHWCGGTNQELQVLRSQALAEGDRAADHSLITAERAYAEAGHSGAIPRLARADAKGTLRRLFHQSMKGRTMYVVPFVIPADGAEPEIGGLQLTDSAVVAGSVESAFPSGDLAWAHLTGGKPFWLCLHASGNQEPPDDRVRWELPIEKTLWAYGPGYGVETLKRVLRHT